MKKKFFYSLIIVFGLFCSIAASQSASAFTSYQNCLDTSGGRGHIPSVQWACSGGWSNYTNYCSLWLGPAPTTSPVYNDPNSRTMEITVNSLDTSYSGAGYYGMCTRQPNTTASITVYYTDRETKNPYFDVSKNLNRGNWSQPGYLPTTINIRGLVESGPSCTTTSKGCEYKREVYIERCHGGNASSCSGQDQTIIITLADAKYQARSTILDSKGAAISASDTDWQDSKTVTKTTKVPCDNPSGCRVIFQLSLQTVSGAGKTWYALARKVGGAPNVDDERIISAQSAGGSWKYEETIQPGQTICYGIIFHAKGFVDATDRYIETSCISTENVASDFQGYASASVGAVNISTDWQTASTYKGTTITCNNASGCETTFKLGLKRTSGVGNTTYYIERGNSRESTSAIEGPLIGSSATRTYKVRIKPGETVCYDIKFKPGGNKLDDGAGGGWAWEKACVSAQSTPPPTPSCPGSGFLDMNVKNDSVANVWKKTEYAKPGDTLTYCTYYDPSSTQGSSGYNFTDYDCAGNCGNFAQPLGIGLGLSNSIRTYLNTKLNDHPNTQSGTPFNYSYQRGSTANHSETNSRKVSMSDTGNAIDEQTQTTGSTPTSTAYVTQTTNPRSYNTCPYNHYECDPYACSPCVSWNYGDDGKQTGCAEWSTCHHDCWDHYVVGHISTATAYSPVAHGHVPYNFVNSTNIETDESTILYAGESKTFDLTLTVSPKQNSTTNGYYATQVHNAKWKLRVWYNGTYYDTYETTNEMLNMDESYLSTGSTVSRQKNIVVPDAPAGTRVCVQSLIYPANSGSNTNWSDQGGSHTWAVSSQKCYTVAKRPSIQFWGGNIYSSMDINTTGSTAVKYHVNNVNTYYADLQRYTTAQVFGSFVDQASIATGKINGLASGATLGYTLGNRENKPGSFCNRIPLSFANTDGLSLLASCSATGQLSSLATADSNKNTLKDKYVYNQNTFSGSTLSNFRSDQAASGDVYKGNDAYYYDNQGNLTIGANPTGTIYVPKNTTQVVHGRTLTINTNLVYGDYNNDTFTSLANLPKLLIYADQEVKIKCGVNRIDAIIVAKKVTTCEEGTTAKIIDGSSANRVNSNQLFVNGTIITSNLVANRTYGAAVGKYSSLAAEIINYDPSLYYWSTSSVSKNASSDNADLDLSTTYQKELAPRF